MSEIRTEDASAAAALVGDRWAKLEGARILLTGCTGFLGGGLVETLLWANEQRGLGARVSVLTRDPDAARLRQPWLANEAVTFIGGDIATFPAPQSAFTHCIHGAAVAGVSLDDQDGAALSRTIVEGTRRCLAAAARAGVREFLIVSSGAVYGPQPADVSALSEESSQAPLGRTPQDRYAQAKRAAEQLCLAEAGRLHPRIARCFAFLGPGMPMDARYAAGNFIRDAVAGGPIRIEGDGAAVRSYLYSGDAAAWLWTILLSGENEGIYNVGSPDGVDLGPRA